MSYYSNSEIGCYGCIIMLIIAAIFNLFFAWIFMLLWNWLMPMIFEFPELTYWQAFGLMFLLSFIGGFFSKKS